MIDTYISTRIFNQSTIMILTPWFSLKIARKNFMICDFIFMQVDHEDYSTYSSIFNESFIVIDYPGVSVIKDYLCPLLLLKKTHAIIKPIMMPPAPTPMAIRRVFGSLFSMHEWESKTKGYSQAIQTVELLQRIQWSITEEQRWHVLSDKRVYLYTQEQVEPMRSKLLVRLQLRHVLRSLQLKHPKIDEEHNWHLLPFNPYPSEQMHLLLFRLKWSSSLQFVQVFKSLHFRQPAIDEEHN